ncbi:DsrE family protein [Sandaracinobacter sp. RS1-74]|uniref:DsrE family protein n=1 Tax=Sandaracinobacteroides sayramensis TaxID=2913411 RepID=UPI001EDB5751|nr:DsrE family protein [Sandaracinobacteroides sayramensis]MCG2842709.1 DsrE family protein [Sandaracinobacteroides sayramensis]
MPGLLLILTETEGERFLASVELAATAAALDRQVAILLRGTAVKGLPEPALALLRELGVHIAACQTAMADHGLTAADLQPGVEALGMVAFLQGRGHWQLLLA